VACACVLVPPGRGPPPDHAGTGLDRAGGGGGETRDKSAVDRPPRRGAKGGSAHRGRSSATAYRRERSYGVGDGLRTVFANTQASAETHAHAGTPAQRGSRGGRVPGRGWAYTPSGSHRAIQSGCWPVSHALRGSGGARGRMGLRSTVQTAVGQSPLSLTRRMAHRLRAKVLIHETGLGHFVLWRTASLNCG
jgi:hypothetical protein